MSRAMKGNRPTIPKQAASDVPDGLCWYELMMHLGVNRAQAKLWAFHTGYQAVDGRTKYSGNFECAANGMETYRQVLTEHADTKTLQEIGDMLNITRERVRQLYNLFGITRNKHPHTSSRNTALIELIRQEAPNHDTIHALAKAIGREHSTVARLKRQFDIPFMSRTQKIKAEEARTGLRTCCKCHIAKPLDEFYSTGQRQGGRGTCNYSAIQSTRPDHRTD